ncbi:hypothetical protein PPERSA_08963 [Pseudocohnilembus persalinus]|uniref:Uncharacterized protein n=1 Tax=Pseudocohnilembus persalinus TaxID=266149 RepID=A0A0V0R317_PSEPJ|nr:hypothetical protein PPERSA_08963 [Pseudocohnilembus persalinus]|eukprot:KRX08859.1 hypothetical protein PPERSA_08963 [Pseudocohnilembus persalinus]
MQSIKLNNSPQADNKFTEIYKNENNIDNIKKEDTYRLQQYQHKQTQNKEIQKQEQNINSPISQKSAQFNKLSKFINQSTAAQSLENYSKNKQYSSFHSNTDREQNIDKQQKYQQDENIQNQQQKQLLQGYLDIAKGGIIRDTFKEQNDEVRKKDEEYQFFKDKMKKKLFISQPIDLNENEKMKSVQEKILQNMENRKKDFQEDNLKQVSELNMENYMKYVQQQQKQNKNQDKKNQHIKADPQQIISQNKNNNKNINKNNKKLYRNTFSSFHSPNKYVINKDQIQKNNQNKDFNKNNDNNKINNDDFQSKKISNIENRVKNKSVDEIQRIKDQWLELNREKQEQREIMDEINFKRQQFLDSLGPLAKNKIVQQNKCESQIENLGQEFGQKNGGLQLQEKNQNPLLTFSMQQLEVRKRKGLQNIKEYMKEKSVKKIQEASRQEIQMYQFEANQEIKEAIQICKEEVEINKKKNLEILDLKNQIENLTKKNIKLQNLIEQLEKQNEQAQKEVQSVYQYRVELKEFQELYPNFELKKFKLNDELEEQKQEIQFYQQKQQKKQNHIEEDYQAKINMLRKQIFELQKENEQQKKLHEEFENQKVENIKVFNKILEVYNQWTDQLDIYEIRQNQICKDLQIFQEKVDNKSIEIGKNLGGPIQILEVLQDNR